MKQDLGTSLGQPWFKMMTWKTRDLKSEKQNKERNKNDLNEKNKAQTFEDA